VASQQSGAWLLGIVRTLKQAPIELGEALEALAHTQVIACHGADLGNPLLADVFGDSFAVEFGGEVVATLGRSFVQGTLEEVQIVEDLLFELLLAEAEGVDGFHSVRVTTHTECTQKQAKSRSVYRKSTKKLKKELNCYVGWHSQNGSDLEV
jgi:hypothetical protein